MRRVVIDLHAGGSEAVLSRCAPRCIRFPIRRSGRRRVAVAALFDTPFVFVYSRQMASGLLTDEAEDEGKIAIGGEFGVGEGSSVRGVRHAYEGVKNVLRHYGMLAGEVHASARRSSDAAAPGAGSRTWLTTFLARSMAIWEPVVGPGRRSAEGQLIGRLHDFADHASAPLEITRAPCRRRHRDALRRRVPARGRRSTSSRRMCEAP